MDVDHPLCLPDEKNSKMIAESSESMEKQNHMDNDCDDVFGDDSEIEWVFEDSILANLQSESKSYVDVQLRSNSESSETGEKTFSSNPVDQLSSSRCEQPNFNSEREISDDSGNETYQNHDEDIFGDDSEVEWVFTDPFFLEMESKLVNSNDDNESDGKSSGMDTKDMEYSSSDTSLLNHPTCESNSKFDQDIELFDESLDEIMSSIQISSSQSIESPVVSSGCELEKCINNDNESDEQKVKEEVKPLGILDTETPETNLCNKRTIESSQDGECPKLSEKNVFESWPKKKRIMEQSSNIPSSQVIETNLRNNEKIVPFGENYTKEAKLILVAVKSFSRSKSYLTFTELESVLKGPSRRKIRRRAYLSIDGLLKHVRRSKILHILEHMKFEGYLEEIARKDEFVLKLGPKASQLLAQGSEEQFIVPILPSEEAKFQGESCKQETCKQESQRKLAPIFQRNQRIKEQRAYRKDLEEECYEELRKLTLTIADELGVDPCKLLPNDSLKQLARKLPKSRLEMQEIYGISSGWFEIVGPRYLEICMKYYSVRNPYIC